MTPNEATARQAELALLAGAMLATRLDPAIADALSPADFLDVKHEAIWRHVVAELRSGGEDAPALVVIDRLREAGELELAGGFEYVDSFSQWALHRNLPNAIQAAAQVRHCARLRRIAATAKATAEAADGWGEGTTAALVALRKALDAAGETDRPGCKTALHAIQFDLQGTFADGLRTATPLDRRMPLCPGRLYVIGGRPGHGKTTLALQLALAVLKCNPDSSALVVSVEMTEPELAIKALCCLEGRDFVGMIKAQGAASTVPVQLAADANRDVLERLHLKPARAMDVAIAEAHRLARTSRLACVVIDYLSAMDPPGGKYENQTLAVGAVSRACKALAQDLNCVVLAASQLNRGTGKDDSVPSLRNLRDSGCVEQDADGVLLMHRPDHTEEGEAAQLLVAKNRWGELGSMELVADLQNHRFGWAQQ